MKIAEFANSVDLDGVAQDEPPHLDLRLIVFEYSIRHSLDIAFLKICSVDLDEVAHRVYLLVLEFSI